MATVDSKKRLKGQHRGFTEAEADSIVGLYHAGQGSLTIARRFDVSKKTILDTLKRLGVERRPGKKVTRKIRADILRRYKAGESSGVIAGDLGLSQRHVCDIITAAGITIRGATFYGRKLSQEDKAAVVLAYSGGESSVAIAARFGLDVSSVLEILRRRDVDIRRPWETNPARFAILGKASRHFSDVDAATIAAQYIAGSGTAQIASDWNVAQNLVLATLGYEGVPIRPSHEENRHYRFNERAFADAESNETASYIVGLLMADGCLHQRGRRALAVSIALSGDDGLHLERIREYVGDAPPLAHMDAKKPSPGWENLQPAKRLILCSTKLGNDLRRYGMAPRKSLTARARIVHRGPHAVAFWRGCVDGDGYLTRDRKRNTPIIGFTGSLAMCKQFRTFARSVCRCGAVVGKNGTIFKVEVKGYRAMKMIRLLYGACTIALPRKKALADAMMAEFNEEWCARREAICTGTTLDWVTQEMIANLYAKHGQWRKVAVALKVCVVSLWTLRKRFGMQ